MATAQLIDQAKQEAFVNKVLGDTSATMTTILASIGDRLGLFKDLATNGPATSAEVASRTGTNERYVREWLGGMVAAGYVEYDPATSRFTLPAEHVAAIATEGGPFLFGGIHQMLPALVAVVDQVTEAFHKGGGVRQANYPSGMWDGLERFTAVAGRVVPRFQRPVLHECARRPALAACGGYRSRIRSTISTKSRPDLRRKICSTVILDSA